MGATARAKWSEWVRLWGESGVTGAEFARRHGINAGTLSYWKWRLRKESRVAKRSPAVVVAERSAPKFVELTASLFASRAERVELVVDGVVVRVPDGFDEQTLRRVLAVVSERT